MSFPNGVRLSDSIASKIIEGGFPADLDGLRFSAALNIWEFVPFGGGGGANTIMFGGGRFDNVSETSNQFLPIDTASDVGNTTEAFMQARLYDGASLTDIMVQVSFNAKATDSSFAFRDDGVDVVGSVVTITGGTTGLFENTGFSTAIADDSLINYRITGTAAGSWRTRVFMSRLTIP